ncbi:Chromosome partition protein smc [hydrothermal vent metagenome]|uniref:Chromosome partition protein smc n=1 Tax=hydrothermal vent metagenome TaxID=652676 RepID=A0A1W1CED4_9ZZZZ
MLNLEIELIALLLLTALVGLLMGRFLCKSGESEEREQKKKVIHAFNTSENELEISREKVKEQFLMISELEDTIARREQKINNVEIKLSSSEKQRIKLLEELKILEKYKPRFESLSNESKIQTTIIEKLKSEKIAKQEEIDKSKILTSKLKATIANLKKEKKELEEDKDTLQNRIKSDNNNYMKQEENINKKYIVAIQAKDDAYAKLEKKYKEIIQKKDENYETLELQKSKEYQELKDELESIENEYEEFKINYTLDSDRLEALEKENKKIYNTLDAIAHERDDLLGRLRAISSVVGAVGIDNSSESRQFLLEN